MGFLRSSARDAIRGPQSSRSAPGLGLFAGAAPQSTTAFGSRCSILSFTEYADNISGAWIWTRIRRIGRSRKSIFQEELGYIEGGTITLIDSLIQKIRSLAVVFTWVTPLAASALLIPARRSNALSALKLPRHGRQPVLFRRRGNLHGSTPYVPKLIPDLSAEWKARFDSIHNIGVICVIFKLRPSVSPLFWVNISEPDIEIPGIIEFTNLRDVGGETILYVPYYMPVSHPRFSGSDQQLLDEAFCLSSSG